MKDMQNSKSARHRFRWVIGCTALLLMTGSSVGPAKLVRAGAATPFYKQFNLVSDIPHLAVWTDPKLVNPWGIAFGPIGPFWVADNGTGVSTVYADNGRPFPGPASPLVVTIPPSPGSTDTGTPTGIVFNGTSDFVVAKGSNSGPSLFIFASENGTISGWNPKVKFASAILAADNSASGAVYKGLALGSNVSGNFLFATNFRSGAVDMFDSHFNLVGSFTDPNVPVLFTPFGIRNIGDKLYVTFAKKETPDSDDDEPGPGNGFVDIFDTNGNMIRRLASHGALDSPWGLALAPSDFGPFSNDLLVGNFGDGRINAFDLDSRAFLGQLQNKEGDPISIEGLWALTFGNNVLGGKSNTLYFTAGIDDESHGLFGRINAIPEQVRGRD
jgi:uncharacterized protein (TIGR03118 family)